MKYVLCNSYLFVFVMDRLLSLYLWKGDKIWLKVSIVNVKGAFEKRFGVKNINQYLIPYYNIQS